MRSNGSRDCGLCIFVSFGRTKVLDELISDFFVSPSILTVLNISSKLLEF